MPAFRKHALSLVRIITFQFFLAYFLQSTHSLSVFSVYISLAYIAMPAASLLLPLLRSSHFSAPPTSPLLLAGFILDQLNSGEQGEPMVKTPR